MSDEKLMEIIRSCLSRPAINSPVFKEMGVDYQFNVVRFVHLFARYLAQEGLHEM